MINEQGDHQTHQPIGFIENVAIASLTLALLSFLSPQIGMLGRGLRTTMPALMISMIAISMTARSAFIFAFRRFRFVFLIGVLFLAQAGIRFSLETDRQNELIHTYIVGPVLALVFLLWIAALTELGDAIVHRMRCWLLFGWCLSFALSLPVLIANPGVARLTMGNRAELINAARWAPYGVAEYTGYTTLAICIGPLFKVAGGLNPLARMVSFLLVLMTLLAVFFSTFTMASAMALLSVVFMFLVWAIDGRGVTRILRFLVIIISIALIPTFFIFANSFEQTKFVVTKVERLGKNISNKGLSKGDETARGAWFTEEMNSFAEEPFLGYIPGSTGQRGHGHSSFSNSLVLFGIFGTLMWIIAIYKVFKNSYNNSCYRFERHVLVIGWLIFILSGILNPIWYACSTLAALFALTLPSVGDLPDSSAEV